MSTSLDAAHTYALKVIGGEYRSETAVSMVKKHIRSVFDDLTFDELIGRLTPPIKGAVSKNSYFYVEDPKTSHYGAEIWIGSNPVGSVVLKFSTAPAGTILEIERASFASDWLRFGWFAKAFNTALALEIKQIVFGEDADALIAAPLLGLDGEDEKDSHAVLTGFRRWLAESGKGYAVKFFNDKTMPVYQLAWTEENGRALWPEFVSSDRAPNVRLVLDINGSSPGFSTCAVYVRVMWGSGHIEASHIPDIEIEKKPVISDEWTVKKQSFRIPEPRESDNVFAGFHHMVIEKTNATLLPFGAV